MNWKIINQLAVYEKEGKKAGLLEELVDNFFTEYPQLVSLLSSSIAGKDYVEVERIAHKLKGGSYILGAQSLGDIYSKLEIKAKTKVLDGAESLMSEAEFCSVETEGKFREFISEKQ